MGSKANAFVNKPMKPAIAAGWRDCTELPDNSDSEPLPKNSSIRPPPSALDCNIYTGKAGKVEATVTSADTVSPIPTTSISSDVSMPASGPDMEKSYRASKVGGGDLMGVIAPSKPVCIDGTKVGNPMWNYTSR
jgi:hypothetical protein